LADRLGRFIYEVEEITIDEYNEWVAYFKIDTERQKRGK
jgi:hypothetical protein